MFPKGDPMTTTNRDEHPAPATRAIARAAPAAAETDAPAGGGRRAGGMSSSGVRRKATDVFDLRSRRARAPSDGRAVARRRSTSSSRTTPASWRSSSGASGARDLAEEILQDAFVRGLSRGAGARLRDDESAVAWFYRLLRNAHRRSTRGARRPSGAPSHAWRASPTTPERARPRARRGDLRVRRQPGRDARARRTSARSERVELGDDERARLRGRGGHHARARRRAALPRAAGAAPARRAELRHVRDARLLRVRVPAPSRTPTRDGGRRANSRLLYSPPMKPVGAGQPPSRDPEKAKRAARDPARPGEKCDADPARGGPSSTARAARARPIASPCARTASSRSGASRTATSVPCPSSGGSRCARMAARPRSRRRPTRARPAACASSRAPKTRSRSRARAERYGR